MKNDQSQKSSARPVGRLPLKTKIKAGAPKYPDPHWPPKSGEHRPPGQWPPGQ